MNLEYNLIVRNLDLYYVCCYIVICTVLNVSVIILFIMECLQIKFCIFEYSREVTVFQKQLFKNRFRKDNSFSKTTVVYLIITYTRVVVNLENTAKSMLNT